MGAIGANKSRTGPGRAFRGPLDRCYECVTVVDLATDWDVF